MTESNSQNLLFSIDDYLDEERVQAAKKREEETRLKEAEQATERKGKRGTYTRANPTIKLFEFTNGRFILPTYSKGDAIGVPLEFTRKFLTGPGLFTTGSYKGFGTKYGHVSGYLLQAKHWELEQSRKEHKVRKKLEILPLPKILSATQQEKIVRDYNVNLQHLLKGKDANIFENIFLTDVYTHCGETPAKKYNQ